MKTPRSSISKTAAVIVIVSATAWSSVGVHAQDQTQTQTQVYGHQLMTDAERTAYQTKMRTLDVPRVDETLAALSTAAAGR